MRRKRRRTNTDGVLIYKYKDLFIIRLDEYTQTNSDGTKFTFEVLSYDTNRKKFVCRKVKKNSNDAIIWKKWKNVEVSRKFIVDGIRSDKLERTFTNGNRTAKELNIYFKNIKKGDKFEYNSKIYTVLHKTKYYIRTDEYSEISKYRLRHLIETGEITLLNVPSDPKLEVEPLTKQQMNGLNLIKGWMCSLQTSNQIFEYLPNRVHFKYIPTDFDNFYILFNGLGWGDRHPSFNKFWMLILRVIKQRFVKSSDKNYLNFIRMAYIEYSKK